MGRGLIYICIFVLFAFMIFPVEKRIVHADLYIWTDANGIRHVSNVSPPQDEIAEQLSEDDVVFPEGQTFRVVRVFDGDTVRVTGMGLTFKIRLVGIDAPETGWKSKAGQPYGKAATDLLSRMVLDRDVVLRQYGTGGYNRMLAEVIIDGKNINVEMLEKGMAEVYRGKVARGIDMNRYKEAETFARQRNIGIWSLGKAYQSPRQWRREHPRK
ncbi:MAG TPA: nuclease [Desulfobacteraceae bacterium]|nr:nuclease [Desulfobacteraceae bacterium]